MGVAFYFFCDFPEKCLDGDKVPVPVYVVGDLNGEVVVLESLSSPLTLIRFEALGFELGRFLVATVKLRCCCLTSSREPSV